MREKSTVYDKMLSHYLPEGLRKVAGHTYAGISTCKQDALPLYQPVQPHGL
jgi:hypothetical protein